VNVESTFERAKDLFQKFLVRSPCVELWIAYLNYVRCVCFILLREQRSCAAKRRINTTPQQQDNIRISYEFALNHIGQDKDSGQIWNDYIQFLKNGEVSLILWGVS
jgi:cleavage stimulation factor subunit 3